MTVKEIVTMFREEKPNKVSDAHIIQWFNEAEAEVQEMLHIPIDEWVKYTVDDLAEDAHTIPVARPPYARMYLFYLMARLDFANQEYESYGNNQAQWDSTMTDFKQTAFREGIGVNDFPKHFINVI